MSAKKIRNPGALKHTLKRISSIPNGLAMLFFTLAFLLPRLVFPQTGYARNAEVFQAESEAINCQALQKVRNYRPTSSAIYSALPEITESASNPAIAMNTTERFMASSVHG